MSEILFYLALLLVAVTNFIKLDSIDKRMHQFELKAESGVIVKGQKTLMCTTWQTKREFTKGI